MSPSRRRQSRIGLLLALIVLMLTLSDATLAARSPATRDNDPHPGLTPDNTAILSNAADRAFCRDFSPLLKGMSAPWHTLERAEGICATGTWSSWAGQRRSTRARWSGSCWQRKNGQR